jgi:DNA repair protein RadC
MRDFNPKEYKVTALRDCPVPAEMAICHEPDQIVAYWRMHIEKHPYFDSECECLAVVLLNARKRVKGHQLLTVGTVDTVHLDNRLIFRSAIIAVTCGIILIHNHPSGDPSPSEADITVTRNLRRAGDLLNIDVVDHVIMGKGNPGYCSLRALGYLAG